MMRVTRRTVRICCGGLAAVAAVAVGELAIHGGTVTAADLDLYVFKGTASATGLSLGLSTTTYSIDSSTKCITESIPSPVSTSVPGYRDLPYGTDHGPCSSVSGGGSLEVVACSTGLISAGWNLTEPSGDVATLSGMGVVVGGVAVVAGDYTDGSVVWPEAGAGVALLLPSPRCDLGPTGFDLTGAVAGAY
jgi:hypothetical protein